MASHQQRSCFVDWNSKMDNGSSYTQVPDFSKQKTHNLRRTQPRRKAKRSCFHCQRAHKTCGNERPCKGCIKRGIPEECIDGTRKIPKYLCNGPTTFIPENLSYCDAQTSEIETSQGKSSDTTHCHANLNSKATQCMHLSSGGKDVSRQGVQFVDPMALHMGDPSLAFKSCQFTETPLEERESALAFSMRIQRSLSTGVVTAILDKERSHLPEGNAGHFSENIQASGDIGRIINVKDQGGTSDLGLIIRSGWSSTFFPCGVNEE